jgi:glycosyltransferase involved in cell wall biosynthesis
MPPRVSILLPAFNAERFVDAAVTSVLRQTMTDWELIAVDDFSTDGTWDVLQRHHAPHIHLHRNPVNLGMTANWNRCLALATGDLVLKLDADDALTPTALESMVTAFDDPAVVACGIRSLQCDESLEPFDGIQGDDAMQRRGVDPYRDAVRPGEAWYDIAAEGYQLWSSSAIMVRRDVLQCAQGWDDRFGCASDTELLWRLMELRRPIAHRGRVGLLYRVRPGSISDVYRSRGWLTWEGVAANLLSLSRVRAANGLRRGLRMHYARLWQKWQSSTRELPQDICGKLDAVMAHVPEPPLQDRLMTKLRDGVSAG